jgi:hypothetical protein
MRELTGQQLEVLKFVGEHVEQFGVPPTQRAVGSHMGFSSRTAARDHLIALEAKGMVKRTNLGSRNLKLTDEGLALLRGLRENREAARREIVWKNGTRKIIVDPAPHHAGGVLIRMFCRKRTGIKWRADVGPRSEIWMPAPAARHLALQIQDLTTTTKPFMIRLAEEGE